MCIIEVGDDGEGIEEKILQQIFEPFVSTKEKGTGLGLTVVQKIVEAHDGSVKIESRVDEGTKVIVELPVN